MSAVDIILVVAYLITIFTALYLTLNILTLPKCIEGICLVKLPDNLWLSKTESNEYIVSLVSGSEAIVYVIYVNNSIVYAKYMSIPRTLIADKITTLSPTVNTTELIKIWSPYYTNTLTGLLVTHVKVENISNDVYLNIKYPMIFKVKSR